MRKKKNVNSYKEVTGLIICFFVIECSKMCENTRAI